MKPPHTGNFKFILYCLLLKKILRNSYDTTTSLQTDNKRRITHQMILITDINKKMM